MPQWETGLSQKQLVGKPLVGSTPTRSTMLLKDLKISKKALEEDRQRKGKLPCRPINKNAPRIIIEVQDGRVYWISGEIDIQVVVINHDRGAISRRTYQQATRDFLQEIFELADELIKMDLDDD